MRNPLFALAALALVAGAPASAQDAPAKAASTRDFVVIHKDLDLSSAKDRKALKSRISSAARAYCGMDAVVTGSRVKPGSSQCYRDAVDAAEQQMATLITEAQKGG